MSQARLHQSCGENDTILYKILLFRVLPCCCGKLIIKKVPGSSYQAQIQKELKIICKILYYQRSSSITSTFAPDSQSLYFMPYDFFVFRTIIISKNVVILCSRM